MSVSGYPVNTQIWTNNTVNPRFVLCWVCGALQPILTSLLFTQCSQFSLSNLVVHNDTEERQGASRHNYIYLSLSIVQWRVAGLAAWCLAGNCSECLLNYGKVIVQSRNEKESDAICYRISEANNHPQNQTFHLEFSLVCVACWCLLSEHTSRYKLRKGSLFISRESNHIVNNLQRTQVLKSIITCLNDLGTVTLSFLQILKVFLALHIAATHSKGKYLPVFIRLATFV